MDVENANCKLNVSQCTDMEILPMERPLKVDCEINGLDHLVSELHSIFARDHVNVQDVQKLMAAYKSDAREWRKYAKYDRFRYTRNLVDAGNGCFNIMLLCWGGGHASGIHDHADSHCFMKLLAGSLEEVRYDWPKNVQPEVLKQLNKRKRCQSCQLSGNSNCQNGNNNCFNGDGNCHNGNRNDHNGNGITENNNSVCEKNTTSCENSNKDSKNGNNGGTHCENGGTQCQKSGTNCENGGDSCQNEMKYQDEAYDVDSMVEIGRTRLEVNEVCYINDALGLHRMENPSHVDGAVSLHLYCPPFDSCRVFDARTGHPTSVKVTFTSVDGKRVRKAAEANVADSQ